MAFDSILNYIMDDEEKKVAQTLLELPELINQSQIAFPPPPPLTPRTSVHGDTKPMVMLPSESDFEPQKSKKIISMKKEYIKVKKNYNKLLNFCSKLKAPKSEPSSCKVSKSDVQPANGEPQHLPSIAHQPPLSSNQMAPVQEKRGKNQDSRDQGLSVSHQQQPLVTDQTAHKHSSLKFVLKLASTNISKGQNHSS